MLWQRFAARRALAAAPMDCRWGSGGTAPAQRSRAAHVPLVVREPEASWWDVQARSSVTVAAVREGDAGWHPEMVVARLAELAVDDELLVVFGSGARAVLHNLIAELRASLPRHEVVTVPVRHRHGQLLRDAATVERLLDAGSLPVVVTTASAMQDVTAEIASYLRADRVLRVLRTVEGADLYQVWERRPRLGEPSIN